MSEKCWIVWRGKNGTAVTRDRFVADSKASEIGSSVRSCSSCEHAADILAGSLDHRTRIHERDLKAHKDGVASLKEELSKSKSRVTELEEKSEMAESELLKREDKLRAISEENRRFREQVQGYKACERAYSSTTTFTDSAEDRNGDLNTIESTMACEDQDTDLASNGSVFPSEEAANPGPRSSPIDSNCPMGPEAVATGSPRRVSIAVTSSSSAEHAAATDLLFQHTSGALALTMNDAKIVIASEQLMEAASFTHFDVMKKEFRVELSL